MIDFTSEDIWYIGVIAIVVILMSIAIWYLCDVCDEIDI